MSPDAANPVIISDHGRTTFYDNLSGVCVRIGAQRSGRGTLILLFVLGVWTSVTIRHLPLLIGASVEHSATLPDVLILVFWAAWVTFGANALYGLLVELFGGERICLVHEGLTIERRLCGFGHTSRFGLLEIRSARVMDPSRTTVIRGWAFGRSHAGRIAFEYRDRTIRFGEDLELTEAEMVLRHLREHGFPAQGG
jgi:hypothetical protein